MADKDIFRLNDADDKFISKFTKYMQRSRFIVGVLVLIFISALIHLALGIRFGHLIDYIMASVFVSAGISMSLIYRTFKRLYSIIMQMQNQIDKKMD